MKRSDFLKNALMAVAVSLLPEILCPTTKWIAGESPVPDELSFTYDPKKTYLTFHNGAEVWFNGATLNYMNEWERERRKGLCDKWSNKL